MYGLGNLIYKCRLLTECRCCWEKNTRARARVRTSGDASALQTGLAALRKFVALVTRNEVSDESHIPLSYVDSYRDPSPSCHSHCTTSILA